LTKLFESFLAPQLEQFVVYRQALGYNQKILISPLKSFDRYLTEKKIKPQMLTPSFFLEFRGNLKVESRSVNAVLSNTRSFFRYLVRQGHYKHNPLKDIPQLPENDVIPFVFSPEQTDQLLKAASQRLRPIQKYYLHDLSLYLALVLLARCGMRISEPTRLLKSHYRVHEKTLYIEKTKFKKDRLIPVPLAVAAELENYLNVRKTLTNRDRNPYLLIGNQRQWISGGQIDSVFHRAVKDIGLNQSRLVIGQTNFSPPTPHSLRHSFAINTLRQVKDRGRSPQNALPILAVYMGHSEYKHTIHYLKVIDAKQRQGLMEFTLSQHEEP
jgi:integrase/recombinase XerD